ncbi:MAG: hypothetical protein K2N91_07700, partial [Muribaculaceae bacterium]|nr:hypothetical protein [Muribaculaceae bacterium]
MKRLLIIPVLALLCLLPAISQKPKKSSNSNPGQVMVFGVAFYNLENLFDTLNNNGTYDLEFSPAGSRQWDGQKYWSKIGNLSSDITLMTK